MEKNKFANLSVSSFLKITSMVVIMGLILRVVLLFNPTTVVDYSPVGWSEAAINFLALGMDSEKSTFWIQHDVKEVLELYWILSNHTSMGLLERAHSYKDTTSRGISANH